MLALRLARGARPAVQLRRLLVAAASAGTGFLLLCTLGYALGHPDASAAAALRLAWCVAPLAATAQFAVAVARTDPATRPRSGLSAIGLGPGRLMILAAISTAVSCTLGSMVALLFFLHLRGDLTGLPFDGAAAELLAADRPLPLPAALTLLTLVPVIASVASAVVLRPRGGKPGPSTARPRPGRFGAFGAYGSTGEHLGFGAYGRFGAHGGAAAGGHGTGPGESGRSERDGASRARDTHGTPDGHSGHTNHTGHDGHGRTEPLDSSAAPDEPRRSGALGDARHEGRSGDQDNPGSPEGSDGPGLRRLPGQVLDAQYPAPLSTPSGLPWGTAVLAAGLAVETYAGRTAPTLGRAALPGGFTDGPVGLLVGWALTAVGLALAGPGITHLCGRLLQAVRPGVLRLLAGRVLMEEAGRIGRPLGVVSAVASGAYAMAALYTGTRLDVGPLTTLGAFLVAGCAVATLLTAAVEARDARADTTAALLRIGAPATMLRSAAALRAGTLFAVFGPLTWAVAELAALPLTG
ncbi:hypothetical protein [Streptomyces sp. 2A115]|uniref:hypothetical protein n=1 Tax=Streptomyces sp. 2A115 TaxID=3457439 RepID=UPI003FCF0EC0